MKRQDIHTPLLLCAAILSLPLLLLSSCSIMQDDRSDCPDCRNPLHITLRYDYNTARANMFSDHVEEATVYVVDAKTNAVVETQTAAYDTPDKTKRAPSFIFNVEGLTPGSYRLYATGRSAADAAFKMSTPDIAETMDQLTFTVPSDNSGNVPALRLDTVWNTLKPVSIDIPENGATEAVIPLMRLTNDLSVLIFRRDTPGDNSHDRYEVFVADEHPALGYDNCPSVLTPSPSTKLTYHPFAAWTTETTVPTVSDGSPVGGSTVAEHNAHYDLTLSRLIVHDDATHNARLIIRNREDGKEIVNIDLCYYLSLARNAYEYQHYSTQEYLDREYDYRLDFGIEGNTWKYMTIRINTLSWALRIQNEEL